MKTQLICALAALAIGTSCAMAQEFDTSTPSTQYSKNIKEPVQVQVSPGPSIGWNYGENNVMSNVIDVCKDKAGDKEFDFSLKRRLDGFSINCEIKNKNTTTILK